MFNGRRYLAQRLDDTGTWDNFMTAHAPFRFLQVPEDERHRFRSVDLRDNPQLVAQLVANWPATG